VLQQIVYDVLLLLQLAKESLVVALLPFGVLVAMDLMLHFEVLTLELVQLHPQR
jgi:hypothetical protein